MNDSQKQFIELLNAAIHKQKVDLNNRNLNWNEIIEEAKEHDVRGLIYSAINKSDAEIVGLDLYEQLKKDTLFSAIYQKNHINTISQVFSEFEKYNIDVIALKGLVTRNLYPNPDLRTMGDADILVKEIDLDKVRKVLLDMGYIEEKSTDYHISFKKGGALEIEVHWTLTKKQYLNNISFFEDRVWKKAEFNYVGNNNVLVMNKNDLLLYLFIHLSSHAGIFGFGVRHLVDIVLLVDKERNNIDWNQFKEDINKFDIEKFTMIIFRVCNKLFNLDIPKKLEYIDNDKNINKFIQKIMQSGVHGKRFNTNRFSNELIRKSGISGNKSKRVKYIRMVFPEKSKLEDKYKYVKKYTIFLPLAWVHRIINAIIGRKYSTRDQFDILFKSYDAAKEKEEILNWLEL